MIVGMRKYNLIVCDTREKGNKKILEYFEMVDQDYIISKLDAGDYMVFKDYTTIIDKKDGLLELTGNLCKKKEHERIRREIETAKQLGCKNFIFLIQDDSIKSIDDIKKWKSKYTKVSGETLLKIMKTMQEKYKIRFIITSKDNIANKIQELLGVKNEN